MTDSTAYKVGGSTGVVMDGLPVRICKAELNIANVATLVTTGGLATILTLPANCYFRFLYAESVTAVSLDSSTGGRIDIGDIDDDDQYVTNQTTFTAGTAFTIASGGNVHTDGEVVGAADAVKIKLAGDKMSGGTANATGIVRIVYLLGDCGRNARMTT